MLHASADIEVVEIGVPAQHVTTIEHNMELPNSPAFPDREYQGQRFVHHRKDTAAWTPFRLPGFRCRDSGISAGTKGMAGVQIAARADDRTAWSKHTADIHFSFVLEGGMLLEGEGNDPQRLGPGDAFVLPPGMLTRYSDVSADLELLEVTLPGDFETVFAG